MAKKTAEGRTFNVSVIGLSGTEKDKGIYGVGKSCLCNRFLHSVADKYYYEHIAVLSQSDFAGRVINNDNFLYWGQVIKTHEGNNFTFHVIEQTDFVDDVSFMPFKSGRTDSYHKRCMATKVQSAEKLMYICKDQLGVETDSAYEQKVMPDGKLGIDGIICCFDVSVVPDRTLEQQVEYVLQLLNSAMKTKRPIVVVTTKNDSMTVEYVKEVERLLARKEFKGSIPLVETSAHENVNIETAFLLLAHMIDKSKTRTKVSPFSDAMRARKEIVSVAKEAFKNLLRQKITDSKTIWASARKKLEKEPDYQHFVDLLGTDQAHKVVRQHTIQLREDLIQRRQNLFLKRLPDVLDHFLPDLETIANRSWSSCQNVMTRNEDFNEFFVTVCEPGVSWQDTDFVDDVQEFRLPFDLLFTPEAETCFLNHVNALQAAHRKSELKREFRSLLQKHCDIPGALLSDNYTLFLGKDCYTGLEEWERQHVFDTHMRELKTLLRVDFQELLWERHHVFRSLNLNQNLTEDDLNVIYNSLNDDRRFRKLYRLEDDRKVMLLNHVVFLDRPSVDRCFFHRSDSQCVCTECQVSSVLQKQRHIIPPSDSMTSLRRALPDGDITRGSAATPLNLVLLGKDGLATELYREIRNLYEEDLCRVGNRTYSLDYRPIDGDVSQEQNAFSVANFKPHGCVCVYSSQESLEYIRSSIRKTLEADLSRDEGKTLDGVPIVVMLAYVPYTQKELHYLRENGKVLARSLQCEFVDIPDEDLAEKLKFYPEQIEQAMSAIIGSGSTSIGQRIMEDTEPDLRVLLCMMCADPYPMAVALQPFLNDPSFVVTSDPETSSGPEEDNVFTIDVNLDYTKHKLEVTATSYHGAHLLCSRGEIYHGFILAYCPKRKASLATLRAFADPLAPMCMLMLAIPEGGGGLFNMNEHSQGLKDGKELSKVLQARFMQTTANFHQQTAMQVYEKFLREVWEHHDEIDSDEPSPPPAYDPLYQRPPAPLPNTYISTSNSQSTEDSEPLYDQPVIVYGRERQSDNDRTSSPSPPPLPMSSPPPDAEVYSAVRHDLELVKPSMIKARRTQYAGPLREQYRKSFPAVESKIVPKPLKVFTSQSMSEHLSRSMAEHLDVDADTQSAGQVKKSRSMKLVAKDGTEAWAINEPGSRPATRPSPYLQSTYNASRQHETVSEHPKREVEESPYHNAVHGPSAYRSSKPKPRPKPLSLAQYGLAKSGPRPKGSIHAPLALQENIDISEEYATVKDALFVGAESDYALVDDALPAGKLHRIKSTSRNNGKVTDSEESDVSSLERKDIYSKVKRKPTPHKKKHKHHHAQTSFISHTYHETTGPGRLPVVKARSHSPSEDSGGTGDEILADRRPKRRSLKKKTNSPGSGRGPGTFGATLSDSDIVTSVQGRSVNVIEDDDSSSVLKDDSSGIIKVGSEEGDLDLNESGSWGTRFKKKTGKDTLRTREMRLLREEERRRQKEEEKRQKEQQKIQKKIKKKDSKAAGQSESGISLHDYAMSPSNPSVPLFIEKCVEFIEEEGLHAEGIYRIPGNKAQVDLLSSKITDEGNVDISSLDIQVNAVATVLKAFFADLTDPLVPASLYDELIEASGVVDKTARIIALRGVFLRMHPLNFEVLKFLITHLHKVGKSCDQNSMDCKNLSLCWWPTLIRMEFETIDKLAKYSRIPVEILQTLIEQCSFFFHSGNEI